MIFINAALFGVRTEHQNYNRRKYEVMTYTTFRVLLSGVNGTTQKQQAYMLIHPES